MSTYRDAAKSLHKVIHKALIEGWNPIGVGDIPEAQDEYDSYIPSIYKNAYFQAVTARNIRLSLVA